MESEWIKWLRERLPTSPGVEVGLGDDAAVLRAGAASSSRIVVTTDLLTDQVHFELGKHDPRQIGYKALAANLSDLAAMAARPTAAFVSIALPHSGGLELAKQIYEGFLPLAERYEVAIAGGDTNSWAESLVISMTLLGQTTDRGPLLRRGALPGDQLLVTGTFGGSILGRHLQFEPRVNESLHLHGAYQLHAGLDCSDGLLLDTHRLCEESGCGALIDLQAVPISPQAEQLTQQSADGRSALDHALSDGEDFELILAVPPAEAERILSDQPLDVPLTRIGEFVDEPGLWQTTAAGRAALSPRGFLHG